MATGAGLASGPEEMVALCQVAKKYVDVASPIDSETRHMIEENVLAAYQPFANEPVKRRL